LAGAGTFFLTFSGGEVFLRSDLFELLEFARRLNFSISLFTSGTVGIDQKKIRLLGDLGIGAIAVSLYSHNPSTHDMITRNPGSWNKVSQLIKNCLDNKILTIINTVILKQNYKDLLALKNFCQKNKLEIRFDCDLAPRWDGVRHLEGLALDQEEKDEISVFIRDVLCQQERFDDAMEDFSEPVSCKTGMDKCYISPRGEVRPCIDIHRVCGRLTTDTNFQGLWSNSIELNQIRRFLASNNNLDKPLCRMLSANKIDYNSVFSDIN